MNFKIRVAESMSVVNFYDFRIQLNITHKDPNSISLRLTHAGKYHNRK